MKVITNTTVSYAVNSVQIGMISVIPDPASNLVFSVTFGWFDAADKPLRQSGQRYTAAQLEAASPDPAQAATYLAALKTLMPVGIAPAMRIQVSDASIATVQGFCSTMVGEPPVKTFKAVTYTEAQLVAAGVSSAIIAGLVSQMAVALTA